ncbi:MAG TPA: MauE/DoxX family redox-associated membrane protein [Pseudonocardiaceae bacterium]
MNPVATVAAATVGLVLLIAAAAHARRPHRLVAALRTQAVVPPAAVVPVAAAVVTAEVVLGAVLLGDVTGLAPAGAAGGPLAAFVLFACYAGYTEYLRRTRAGEVPCGCGDEQPVTPWVVARAAALGAGSLVAAAGTVGRPGDLPALLVLTCAAVVFAVLLWQLPAAMHDPERVGR